MLLASVLAGLCVGVLAWLGGNAVLAGRIWMIGTLPVIAALVVAIARDLLAGRFGVDVIALVSMAAAVALGETLAGIVVAIMYTGGNVLEDYAVARAERDLKSLADRSPRIAHLRRGKAIDDVAVAEVAIGDALVVRAGEVVPVDGVVVSETATLDESTVRGEPIPVARRQGEAVLSGSINAGEVFELMATAKAGESTYAGIVRMVTAAQTAKAPFVRLADRFAMLLLPVTLLVAGLAWYLSGDPVRGLAVLVAATPCPLILAAPVAFIAGVSRAARRGILVKGGGPLEALARAETLMFDKTGTLTVGGARLLSLETAPGLQADEVLRLAASLEQASHNVVAQAIVTSATTRNLALTVPGRVQESAGLGLEGMVDGRHVRVGSAQLVLGARRPEDWMARSLRRAAWRSALSVVIEVDGRPAGVLLLGDELKPESPAAIAALRTSGVRRIVMVTGDRADAAETIGAALDLDGVLAERVPADKVEAVATEQRLASTVMVGDGINDAPALAAAAVGIAMGARGASASSEAADVVILVDRLDRVPKAISIAKRTRRIAIQSIVVGMSLSGVAMLFAAFGWLTPVAGALIQEAIDVAVILNALRALTPERRVGRLPVMPAEEARSLEAGHEALTPALDRLRGIADELDDARPSDATRLICEASALVTSRISAHEEVDERRIYPGLDRYLRDRHGLAAMSRAHREILHQSRLLARLAGDLSEASADRYLVRDAQRIIETLEALVRMHNAQEQDIYEHAAGGRAA